MTPRHITYWTRDDWPMPRPGDWLVSVGIRAHAKYMILGVHTLPPHPGRARFRLTVLRDDDGPRPNPAHPTTHHFTLIWDPRRRK